MIMLTVPVYSISLLPIIAIEAIYLRKSLDLTKALSVKMAFVSNLVSTIIGVPLTWVTLVLIQVLTGGGAAYGVDTFVGKMLAVTWQAPWLIPYESDLHWMILFAGLFLLIPFYFVSWWSEFLVSKKILADTALSSNNIKIKVRNANLITYSLLAFWPIGWYVVGYVLK
ncbi:MULTISPECIES: hypothetical protein [unclassified Pseudoalteromonas]|uniref:hypothetical protein n=1 Tax=unclassified Pseudoalteromonas TaxID=194690 RepID=UPI001BB105F2|nr:MULTISPECIES: hypothetical protein [unclassified Pseudoalteromonas]